MTAETINDFVLCFAGIVWEAMPFIVLGALVAGILEDVLPQEALANLLPKNVILSVMIGGALGLVFPMCECGIVVVMRRLLRKGLPLACCIAYMLAGPIVNVIVLFSTYVAFVGYTVGEDQTSLGVPMVLLRGGMGFLVACGTGFVVHFLERRSKSSLLTASAQPPKAELTELPKSKVLGWIKSRLNFPYALGFGLGFGAAFYFGGVLVGVILSLVQFILFLIALLVEYIRMEKIPKTLGQRMNNISSTALGDFLDIMAFLIIGSLLAAFIKTNPAWIKAIQDVSVNQPLIAIPAMMGLAVLLCLCSEADAFLAAGFTGMSVSARLGFLVLGPMFDLKLLVMFTRVFRPKLILTLVICTVVQVMIYCYIVHMLYNPTAGGSAAP